MWEVREMKCHQRIDYTISLTSALHCKVQYHEVDFTWTQFSERGCERKSFITRQKNDLCSHSSSCDIKCVYEIKSCKAEKLLCTCNIVAVLFLIQCLRFASGLAHIFFRLEKSNIIRESSIAERIDSNKKFIALCPLKRTRAASSYQIISNFFLSLCTKCDGQPSSLAITHLIDFHGNSYRFSNWWILKVPFLHKAVWSIKLSSDLRCSHE